MKIVKENKKLLVLIILFSGLLIMQFNFFWNEYVNNNISNMYSYISLSLRPGATTIYNIFYNFEILNSPVMIWLFQFALLLICLVLYYKSISYLINESIAFLSSIFFILSPYTINLMKVIDFYPLILIWYTLSNLVFILYLKKKKPEYVYYLMIINLTGIILDFYFLTFILIQALYLLFQEKLGIKKKYVVYFLLFSILWTTSLWKTMGQYSVVKLDRENLLFEYEYLLQINPQFILKPFQVLTNIILKYNPLFLLSILIITLVGCKSYRSLKNSKYGYYLLFNLIGNIIFFLLIYYFKLDESFDIVHPLTRYFIYVFYWVYIIAGISLNSLIKKVPLRILLTITLLIIFAFDVSEYYKYQSISKAEKAQIDFEYIYQNYNTSYITFLCDDRMQTWSSLKKYSFKNPFLLKSKPTRIKEIDIIYNDINHFFINKIASINILYNNIYEYNDYLIINTNEHFYPNETLPFLNELIKSIEKRNYNMVVIPLNCDLENDEVLSTKFNLINTNGNTLYVSSW